MSLLSIETLNRDAPGPEWRIVISLAKTYSRATRLRDYHAMDDLLGVAVLAVLKTQKGKSTQYMTAVAKNAMIDYVRKDNRVYRAEGQHRDDPLLAEDWELDIEDRAGIFLPDPPDEFGVVESLLAEGKSWAEIADKIDEPVLALKSRHNKRRKSLKKPGNIIP